MDAIIWEWEAKPAADKTWANINSYILTEYAKENKQNKITACQFKASALDKQAEAEATEELIHTTLTKNHTCQMEALNQSTTWH